MEFVTVEQFQAQPLEVQKVFLDWWKPSICDLYVYNDVPYKYRRFTETDAKGEYYSEFMFCKNKMELTPLLTEGQLRKFIEEKSGGIVKVIQWHIEDSILYKKGYSIDILCRDKYQVRYSYGNLGEDLLQAYWKVACSLGLD